MTPHDTPEADDAIRLCRHREITGDDARREWACTRCGKPFAPADAGKGWGHYIIQRAQPGPAQYVCHECGGVFMHADAGASDGR